MRRFLSRLFLVPLAALFLFEAWLWDRLAPAFSRVADALPLRRTKAWLRAVLGRLSPRMTLLVFLVPAVPLFPLKLLALWCLASHHWLLGSLTFALAKIVGVGVTAYLFDLTREKLLRMPWFRAAYEAVLRLRAAAHALVEPAQLELRRLARAFAPGRAGRTLKLLRRIRKASRLAVPR